MKEFIENYQFSSYQDFLEKDRPESVILDFSLIPEYIKEVDLDFKQQEQAFIENKVENW